MRKREKILLIATVALVVVALVKVLVVGPALDRWTASVREERDLEAAVEKAKALSGRYAEVEARRAELSRRLGPSEDAGGASPVPRFLATIRLLAERAQFTPLALRDVRRDEEGAFTLYVFWLRARTDGGSIARFLAELRASDACIRATSLSLTRSGARVTRQDELDADMVLVALTERAPAGKGKETAAAGRASR